MVVFFYTVFDFWALIKKITNNNLNKQINILPFGGQSREPASLISDQFYQDSVCEIKRMSCS